MGILCLSCVISAGATEYEINLVRNPAFLPGMDQQGPRDWSPYYLPGSRTNIYEAGRGNVTFTEDGIILGPGQLFQLGEMLDDISPAYAFSCRMKTEGATGASVELRIRDARNVSLRNTKLGVWEDLAMDVTPDGHNGFCVTINVPEGVRLHIGSIKVVAVLEPAEDVGGQVLISDNGKDVPVRGIRLSAEPNWAEQLAAHELRVNIYLVSGAVLPVFTGEDVPDDTGYIRVASLKKVIPTVPMPREQARALKEPEANGFRLVCRDGTVELTGGNDAGVLASAMHLSELLGAKFYAPRVYTIATNRTLKIPAMEIIKHPAFEWTSGPASQKQTLMGWKYGYVYEDSCVAPSDKASPPMPGWVHPPIFLAPPYLYAESHPDYYALVKGERMGKQAINVSWGYLNLCLGNPELQQVIAERIGRLMDLYPQCRYFSIAQGDGSGWCECDLCTALDVGNGISSDRMIAYANAVAGLLESKYPDRKLVILAYGKGREELPLREKLHPNVAVHYAFWPSSWPVWEATKCEQNKRGMKLLADWNVLTGTNLLLGLYPINTYENADKIKLAADMGIRGFHQCGVRGDFPEIMVYTTGRLIWDPDADVEKMIDEIMPHLYGPAALSMRKYFDMHHAFVRECVADPAKRQLYRETNRHRFRRIPLDDAQKALALLGKAELAASVDEFHLTEIQTEKYKVLYAYINEFNVVHPVIPDELFEDYALKMAELVNLARKCREPFAGYRVPFSEWLYQISDGSLDFDRGPYTWVRDKKIDLFLADPIKTLKTRVYLQEAIKDGVEWPAKAWMGTRYYEKYQGASGAMLRRKSSSESRVKAYFKLDERPEGKTRLELHGLDNEKAETAEIEITINGQKVFVGPVAYPDNSWSWQTYTIPAEVFQQGDNVIVIENTMGDYKEESVDGGEAGPAGEALAKNYNWGWCMVGKARLIWNDE